MQCAVRGLGHGRAVQNTDNGGQRNTRAHAGAFLKGKAAYNTGLLRRSRLIAMCAKDRVHGMGRAAKACRRFERIFVAVIQTGLRTGPFRLKNVAHTITAHKTFHELHNASISSAEIWAENAQRFKP